jgi:hypothetical protein
MNFLSKVGNDPLSNRVIHLVEEGQLVGKLTSHYIEEIADKMIGVLIHNSFHENKDFIIARVVTRNKDDIEMEVKKQESTIKFFSIYSIIKQLFSKRFGNIIGRYHDKYPMPMGLNFKNEVIVDEIKFFLL